MSVFFTYWVFVANVYALGIVNKNMQSDTLVIIGASYAQHWNPKKLSGLRVINKGSEGQQSHELLARFESDVVNAAPKAVIIWGFINDIFRSNPDEIESKIAEIRENISAMIELAKANNIQPILVTEVTITTPDNWVEHVAGLVGWLMGKTSYQEYVNKIVIDTNLWLKEMAAKNDILILDFQRHLSNEDGFRKRGFAKADGSHLSIAAYDALNEYTADMKF